MKKASIIFATLALILAMSVGLVACIHTDPDDIRPAPEHSIVFLGDSIAEGLIGASPLSERDNYGYYAILGKCNDMAYYNHSVSGHKTSGGMAGEGADGFLEIISRESENATLMKTHIEQADVIHISILGNNVLQYDLGLMLMEVADPDFEEKYLEGNTLINALHDGGVMERESLKVPGEMVEFNFPSTYQNIVDVVAQLKALNPTAKIIFQKVYNPFYDGSSLLYWQAANALANTIDDGRFGKEGEPITSIEQIRKLAQYLLDFLNGVLDEYLVEHPGAFTILDIATSFSEVTALDKNADGSVNLSSDSLGASLLYPDWTHPSNFGHAVVACETQKLLEEWGYADENALAKYKAIKVDQIERMYAPIDGFDKDEAISTINGAETFLDVTLAYFGAIDGYTPVNYGMGAAPERHGDAFASDIRFTINNKTTNFMGQFTGGVLGLIENAALNMEETYFEFGSDGMLHAQIVTKDGLLGSIDSLIGLFGGGEDVDIGTVLGGVYLGDIIDKYAEPIFPGFKARVQEGDLEGALNLVRDSLGLNITGLDYSDPALQEALEYIGNTMRLPANLLEVIPEDTVLKLTFDVPYRLINLTANDGTKFVGVYLGWNVKEDPYTLPYGVFTLMENNGVKDLLLRLEFMNISIGLTQMV